MPSLIWSEAAYRDVGRLYDFLATKHRDSARRAVKAVYAGVRAIRRDPGLGRPVEELAVLYRERVIEFGRGAYVIRYSLEGDLVTILNVRHGREDGYGVGPPLVG